MRIDDITEVWDREFGKRPENPFRCPACGGEHAWSDIGGNLESFCVATGTLFIYRVPGVNSGPAE